MPPVKDTTALETKITALEAMVKDLSARLESLEQPEESQLFFPLDPISQALIHENMLLVTGPYATSTPTATGTIPVLLNGIKHNVVIAD